MQDFLAFFSANLIAWIIFYLFFRWMKIKSARVWVSIFLIVFPHIEALNNPGVSFWHIFGIISSIVGVFMLVRVCYSIKCGNDTDRTNGVA